MKKITISLLLLSIFFACEKSALNDASDSLGRPVVESYLQPGRNPSVKVFRQIPFGSTYTTALPIAGLNLRIESDGQNRSLSFTGDTIYAADGSWEPEAGKTYRLFFDYEGSTVTAETIVPAKPTGFYASTSSIEIPSFDIGSGTPPTFPEPVELNWTSEADAWYLVVVENIESDPKEIYDRPADDDRPPPPTFRSQPEQTNTYTIGFQNFQYYGTHHIILYRLNADYAALYDDNGNSSQNLTTPFTNIEGGLGIFSGMNADTLIMEVKE